MSQSLDFPNTSTIGDTGVEEVITIIQRELGRLPWLQNSLGRVRPQYQSVGSLPEPWIYKADGEYYKAYPNDTSNSFSCLYAHDDETFDETGTFGKRTLSVIVWANLEAIQFTTPSVEQLKLDVLQRIRGLYCVMSVNKAFDQTAVGANGIYPGFDISGLATQYLTYPYGAFRIETTVHYTNLKCLI